MKSIIQKYHLNASTWTYKGFHAILHTFFPVGQTGLLMEKFFGDACHTTLFVVKDDYVHWYWNDNDLMRLRELFFARLKKNKNYLHELQISWNRMLQNFDIVIKKVHRTDLTTLSNAKLSNLYDSFYASYVEEFSYFMALGDAISMHADQYLIPEFKTLLGKDFSLVFPQLISPQHTSFLEQEELDRNILVRIFKKMGKIPPKLLDAHSAKYFYITNNYAKVTYLDGEYFLRKIQDQLALKEVTKSKKELEQAMRGKRGLMKKYKLSSWHKTLLYVLDEFFAIQDTRKKYVLISNYYQFWFLQELEKRSGIPFDALKYSVYPEFSKILKGTINATVLQERANGCVCFQTPSGYEINNGKEVQSILNYFRTIPDTIHEIQGIVASRGRRTGRVKILLKVHDMVNIDDGDIIVASMTRPEMILAMRRAGAIVTDEGGLTSHAAIVSRELGIPCIIGTKIATKVLKDGDMVEVDAERGMVRKIT